MTVRNIIDENPQTKLNENPNLVAENQVEQLLNQTPSLFVAENYRLPFGVKYLECVQTHHRITKSQDFAV